MNIRLVKPPNVAPMTVDEIEGVTEFQLTEAIRQVELLNFQKCITQTWRIGLSEFPGRRDPIQLPFGPYVDISISYLDPDGFVRVLPRGDFLIDIWESAPRVVLPADTYWPSSLANNDAAVTIDLTVGFGNGPENVPPKIKDEIRQAARGIQEPIDKVKYSGRRRSQTSPDNPDSDTIAE